MYRNATIKNTLWGQMMRKKKVGADLAWLRRTVHLYLPREVCASLLWALPFYNPVFFLLTVSSSSFINCNSGESFDITTACQQINSESAEARFNGATKIRRMLSVESCPPVQLVIDSGACPVLLKFLEDPGAAEALQFECAWALCNVASSTSQHTQYLLDLGVAGAFQRKLVGTRFAPMPRLPHRTGGGPAAVPVLPADGPAEPASQRGLAGLEPCRGKPQPAFQGIRDLLVPLSRLIYSTDQEILTDACWALAYITDGENERIEAVIQAGIHRRVVELLTFPSPSVSIPALRCVGNLVTGDDRSTQLVLDCGPLPFLRTMFSNPKLSIRKEAVWAVSNVTAGNPAQIQAVIDAGMMADLLGLLETADPETKKQAIWAVGNATSGSAAQISVMVGAGLIRSFVGLLGTPMVSSQPALERVILGALENVVKTGNSLARTHQVGNEYVLQMIQADAVPVLRRLADGSSSGDIATLAQTLLQAMECSYTNPQQVPLEWELSRLSLGSHDNNSNNEADNNDPESNDPNSANYVPKRVAGGNFSF
ncbi:putative Importin subunit alpha-1a [Paratrimastix pyriformis]|uniref:Importin subunit alpha-1a n=1 Tax=Paratrimastix pyriformis TaxID=342808 RepID=A0ABQ8UM33_9EUKA|nr:putative Importin subunit alpha-1a [Paratrimastix pyriformis]